jgi:drug/metabolite transporter (DMT)-like permease
LPASADNSQTRLGFFLWTAITFLWGVNFVAMKVVLDELPPWIFRSLCLGVGGAGMLSICRLSGMSLAIPRSDLKPLLWSALFNITGWHLASAYGIMNMHSGRAMLIAYTMPVWSSLLAVFMVGERLGMRTIIGLVLGVGGILVLLWPDLSQVEASPLGAFFMLIASWCWAAGTVCIKRGPWTMPMSLVTGWMFILGGLPIFIGAFILESPQPLLDISLKAGLTLAYVIFLPTLFCHWAYYRLVGLLSVSLVSLSMLASPILGVLASAWLLDEPLGPPEIISMVLVVSALAVVTIKRN